MEKKKKKKKRNVYIEWREQFPTIISLEEEDEGKEVGWLIIKKKL